MSKPVFNIKITSPDAMTAEVPALFDSGAYYTLIREDKLPSKNFLIYKVPEILDTATKGGALKVIGSLEIIIEHLDKKIKTLALVSPDMTREMIVGAITMQEWDIVIKNKNGSAKVNIGRDMRDPEITEVCYVREIITPENLLHEAVSLQLFLTYCAECEDDIDYKIKLISFIERAKQIHALLKEQYKIKKEKQPAIEEIRAFYDKNWPGYMRRGYNSLSHAFGIFGWLGGDMEGGPPVEKYTLSIMEMLRHDILSLLHEWQNKKRHLKK
ncbi:MAG: hypothetical protein HYY40_09570 [Bacteroidetes bacterium]|nr:hypothetical protein [Bacteroidota bacterium]